MSSRKEYLFEAQNISVRFGGLAALTDVNFKIEAGSITGLIGPNGAGKTTLINVMSGMRRPTSGKLRWRGQEIRKWGLSSAARSGLVRTFQGSRVFNEFTVRENIEIGSLRARSPQNADVLLELLDLNHRKDDLAGSLPFGETRRLGVALALAMQPEALLLDEPGAGLTGRDLDLLSKSLKAIQENGMAIVLVDHNMRFVMKNVERVVVLEGGCVIANGSPEEVQNNSRVQQAYLGSVSHA